MHKNGKTAIQRGMYFREYLRGVELTLLASMMAECDVHQLCRQIRWKQDVDELGKLRCRGGNFENSELLLVAKGVAKPTNNTLQASHSLAQYTF